MKEINMQEILKLLKSEEFKTTLEEMCHEIWANALIKLFNGSCHDIEGTLVIPKSAVEKYKFWIDQEILDTDDIYAQRIINVITSVLEKTNEN